MTRDLHSFHHGAEAGSDHVDLHALARCYRQRCGLPATMFVNGRNVTPAEHLESLAADGKGSCPDAVVELLRLDHHVSVATAARLLLDRLRSTGQLPTASTMAPVPVHGRDAVDTLAQLARIYRAERKPPAQVRTNTATETTASFLTSLMLNKSECPSSVAADIGVMNSPCTMAEAAVSLHGRLRQAGAL